MWSDLGLFATPPQSVFDVYQKTAQGLADLRKTRLANALQQIKLQYAPDMAKGNLDLLRANAAIKQSDAQYEPSMNAADLMLKNLSAQGKRIENAMNSEKYKYYPDQLKLDLAFKQAQIKEALAHAQAYLGKAAGGGKGAPVYLDPVTKQPVSGITADQALGIAPPAQPQQAPDDADDTGETKNNADDDSQDNSSGSADNSAPETQPQAAPESNTSAPAPMAPPAEQTFPGANPKAMNVLAPTGITDSRGHAVAYRNLRTGERFAALTPASRTKLWSQLGSIRQAIPYMDQLIKYGTIGKVEPGGLSQLLPESAGGVSRADAVRYNAILKQSVEHVINGSNLKQTETTLPMIHDVLERKKAESREAYRDRILAYKAHLIDLEKNIADAAGSGIGSVDRYTADAEQKYFENENKKLKSQEKNGDSSGFVRMEAPNGKKYRVPASEVADALKNKYKRIE